jgi:hypothetical protein
MKNIIVHRGVVYRRVPKAKIIASLEQAARETGDKKFLNLAEQLKAKMAQEKPTLTKRRKIAKRARTQGGKRRKK